MVLTFLTVPTQLHDITTHKVTSFSDMKNAIYDLISHITVMSAEMGLALNLHTYSAWFSGKCIMHAKFNFSMFMHYRQDRNIAWEVKGSTLYPSEPRRWGRPPSACQVN